MPLALTLFALSRFYTSMASAQKHDGPSHVDSGVDTTRHAQKTPHANTATVETDAFFVRDAADSAPPSNTIDEIPVLSNINSLSINVLMRDGESTGARHITATCSTTLAIDKIDIMALTARGQLDAVAITSITLEPTATTYTTSANHTDANTAPTMMKLVAAELQAKARTSLNFDCGFTVNSTTAGEFALFTDYSETDFLHERRIDNTD